VDLKTKMGDDRWRFGGTNFVPGVSTQGGLHLSKWSPRLEFSGPVLKSRAWFHNAFDAFYDADTVSGLPRGENRTQGLTTSDLTRFQINLTPANILIGSFLFNLDYDTRAGLSILNPAEATSSHRQTMYMSSVRDQHYFAGGGALLEVGFADTRIALRNLPHGSDVYQMTPYGNRGNYFVWTDRHSYRRQLIANLFLPTVRFHGVHQLKFGVDSERTSFHQVTVRHQYEILRADNSIARRVSFLGGPFQGRKNLDAAHYVQDHWNLREGLSLDAGIRVEWNEVVRNVQLGPRFAAVWAPSRLRDTKFSLGWGAYYDAISLELIARQQDQMSLATYFSPSGLVRGPVGTYFRVNDHALTTPRYQTLSATLERKLPAEFYMRAGYTRRSGSRGFTFSPSNFSMIAGAFYSDGAYDLTNSRRERYDAFDLTLRHTFAGQFEWFAGYTRSSSRSNAAVEYSLENPVFSVQMPGPVPWDAPNRFHTWGWAPVPKQLLPKFLNFAIRNTTLAYLVEYRSGFPFGVVDEEGTAVGAPNSWRFPDYFNINLSFERRFRAMHYQWAWRFGFNNITNNGNPNVVNNVIGTPQFLAYGRGQARAFNVRLRFLGRR
jgi:hypothetical protein